MFKVKLFLLVPIICISCKSPEKFSGFSYDPPGVTNTIGKYIEPQKQRIIGANSPKIWVTNEFEGARLNDFFQVDSSTYEVFIEPENAPINNSPWFAFQIWSDSAQTLTLRLSYKGGKHRYIPKVSTTIDGHKSIEIVDSIRYHKKNGSIEFELDVEPYRKTVSAHSLAGIQYSDLLDYSSQISASFVSVDTVGFSNQNRAIFRVKIDETDASKPAGVLVLLSRQHPPEVSGYRTYNYFMQSLMDSSELAINFRKHFIVQAFPMLNPDGVYNGHWRHNAAGIDLNRDWENFNQPETQAVRNALLPILDDSLKKVFYGIDFHSTNENIFYPIKQDVITFPDDFTQRWFQYVSGDNTELEFIAEEFDTNSPISKNWLFKTFGSDALTFEVDDELSDAQMEHLGSTAARSLMELLLEEWVIFTKQM